MRAIIYTRVSSDPSGHARSVEEQEKDCRDFCEARGWSIEAHLSDNDVGASRFSRGDREQWRRLPEVAQRGDVLVTWESSRAQRDLATYVSLRDLCAERGVLWCYSGRVYDLTRGDDRFITGLDALLAEKEVEQLRDRVKRAHRGNAAAGRPHGKIPYGYRAVRDQKTGKIIEREPHGPEASVIREIVDRVLAGASIYSVVRDLNARGVPTPGGSPQWRASLTTQLLRRPVYAGLRTHHGVVTSGGTWKAIITREEHQTVMALLDNPVRRTHRGSAPVHLLSGIARCGICKGPMHRLKNGGYPAYTCTEKRCVARNVEKLDLMIEELVISRLEDPSLVGAIGQRGSESEQLYHQSRELQARLDDFVRKGIAGEVSASTVGLAEKELLPQIRQLEERARQAALQPVVGEMAGPDARQRWNEASVERRRDVVRAMMRIEVLPTGRGRGWDPATIDWGWIAAPSVKSAGQAG